MSWNSNEQSDSDNDMFQMSSIRLQEDDTSTRLLSASEDNDAQEVSFGNVRPAQLQFRQDRNFNSKQEKKKTKCAIISILISGVILVLMITAGMGIKLKNMKIETTIVPHTCEEEKPQAVEGCPASFPWQSYRLPTWIKPDHYNILLHPKLTYGNYTGEINIGISILKMTNLIVLHSKDLILTDIKVLKNVARKSKTPNLSGTIISQTDNYKVCKEFDFLAILLEEKLIPDQHYTVHIKFTADLGKSLRGFYLSKYKTRSGDNRTLATTQFESTDARAAFPCFDEPAFKANFSLSIVRDDGYIALSNMPVLETKDYGSDLKLDKFETSVAMSTYLVAFIVCDFVSVTKTIVMQSGPVKVSVYAPKDKIDTAPYALNVSCEVLKFYEKVFKVPYPLPKLDLVAIPDFEAGAMENWGLVTYRETLILWDQNSSSIFDQERVALVIAHELAHQWFGNLVTMQWWNDLWLNEGFASFIEYYGVDGITPSWHKMEQFYNDHMFGAMRTDESEYTHPISVTVDSRVQIEEVFDDISYSKAGCVIGMMLEYLGPDAFFGGVSDYLQNFAYKNTVNQDLIKSVAARASSNEQQSNILDMLVSWTTEPGFPIINISLNGNEVVMSQMRYLLSVKKDEDSCRKPKKDGLWHIPVSYRTDSSQTTKWIFLENETRKFLIKGSTKPKWAVFNVQRGGYYVINYDKNLLASLSAQLKKDYTVFSALSRSGILFNVAKSARAGYIAYGSLFDLLLYLKNEEEYEPISTGVDILLDVTSVLKLQFETGAHVKMKMYSKKLVEHLYVKYGWPEGVIDSGLSHPKIRLRKLMISIMCGADDQNCTRKALELFKQWKENGSYLHHDYKDIVYSTAVRLGPSNYWDFIWNKYATDLTIDAHEKQKLLSALCHTSEEKKIVFLLDEAMKGQHIRAQDIRTVFGRLRSTRIGSMIAWKYMRSRWNELTKIFPLGSFATQGMLSIFNSFTDESDIAAGEEFVALNNMTNIRFVKRALDHAKVNVRWIKTYQPQIIKWLDENLERV